MTLASRLQSPQQHTGQIARSNDTAAAIPPPAPAYIPNKDLKDDDLTPAPPFPFEVLHEKMRRVVKDCENLLSFPPDITAAGGTCRYRAGHCPHHTAVLPRRMARNLLHLHGYRGPARLRQEPPAEIRAQPDH